MLFEGIDLPQTILHKLEKAGIFSYSRILELSNFEIRKITSLNEEECQAIQVLTSKLFLDRTALPVRSVITKENRITLDCSVLNKLLGGGLPLRGLTELYGESGAGKTQICLQLSLTVQYPVYHGGLEAGAVYICTEDKFPTNRLNQILQHFPRDPTLKIKMGKTLFGDRIFVDHISDIDGLKKCLFHRLPKLLSNTAVGIVIIDSIAALYRTEYSFRQTMERAKSIRDVALQLHRLSRKFNLAILCINQVSDSMDGNNEKIPVLGLVWTNMVTTRLQAIKYPKRVLKVVHSPDLPNEFCYYSISEKGVIGHNSPSE